MFCFAPIKPQPDGSDIRRVSRILTDSDQGFLNGKRYLIYDRDPLHTTEGFAEILKGSGVQTLKLPARNPDGKHVIDTGIDDQTTEVYSSDTEYKHKKCVLCVPKYLPANLQEIILRWPHLSESIKKMIKILVKSANFYTEFRQGF